jgi:hypothetical protein
LQYNAKGGPKILWPGVGRTNRCFRPVQRFYQGSRFTATSKKVWFIQGIDLHKFESGLFAKGRASFIKSTIQLILTRPLFLTVEMVKK